MRFPMKTFRICWVAAALALSTGVTLFAQLPLVRTPPDQLSPAQLRLKAKADNAPDIPYEAVPDHKSCACGEILRGLKRPTDCKIFGTVCTPENPMGSCMVSPEGACAAHYSYGRWQDGKSVSIPVAAA